MEFSDILMEKKNLADTLSILCLFLQPTYLYQFSWYIHLLRCFIILKCGTYFITQVIGSISIKTVASNPLIKMAHLVICFRSLMSHLEPLSSIVHSVPKICQNHQAQFFFLDMMKGKNGGNESIFCVKAQIFSNMNSLNNDSLAVGSA